MTAPGPGAVLATARRGRKIVAKGAAKPGAAGPQQVRLRFTAAGRKALRPARKAALKVTVTYMPAAGSPVTQALAVTLKR